MANVKQNDILGNANELENKYVSDLNFNILLNILTYVYDIEYKFYKVNKTNFEDYSTKSLYYLFNFNDLHNISRTKLLNLFTEINKRICKKLKITPSMFIDMDTKNKKFAKLSPKNNDEDISSVFMECSCDSNTIFVNFKLLNEVDPISILSMILHETYHSYQIQHIYNELHYNAKIDEDNFIAYFQDLVVFSHKTFNNLQQFNNQVENNELATDSTPKPRKKGQLKADRLIERLDNSYAFNLLELEANMFAHNIMQDLQDQQIISNYNANQCFNKLDTETVFANTYSKINFQREKHLLKTYLSNIKKSLKDNKDLLYDEEILALNDLFDIITPKAIDTYYNKKQEQLRTIKNVFYHEVTTKETDYDFNPDLDIPFNEDI